MKYGMPITYGFSRRNKELADEIRRSMLTMYRLTVKIEKKYFKKTTTQDLDEELAVLRHLIRGPPPQGDGRCARPKGVRFYS